MALGLLLVLAGCAAGRSYELVAPDAAAPRPLLIALHGWLGTPAQMQEMSGLSAAAARLGFAVAYPRGEWRSWGIDPASPDSAFLAALVDEIAARTPIDRARVYAVGFSNGCFMAQALVCSGRLRLAGIAVVASGLAATAAADCPRDTSVPFLLVRGAADPIVPLAGTDRILPAAETLAFWADRNACQGFEQVASEAAGERVVHAIGRHCRAPTEAWLVEGEGHNWPGSAFSYPAFIAGPNSGAIDATAIVLAFLLRLPAR